MKNKYTLEVCAGSVQSGIEAEKGGANRIELCSALYEGGLTPSPATIQLACELINIPVFVIIRPRGGDFLYTDLEFEIMKRDVVFAKQSGAKGIVTGLLNADGTVDIERTSVLVQLAFPLEVTFHRAFDMVSNQQQSLEQVIQAGCSRILTSGGANKALECKDNIAELVRRSSGRIQIMAGSGVTPENVGELIKQTGVTEVHASGKIRVASGMVYKNTNIAMGGIPQIPEYDVDLTDSKIIRSLRKTLDNL